MSFPNSQFQKLTRLGVAFGALAVAWFQVLGTSSGWPAWRGPAANGTSPDATPPTTWSETNHVRWKLALPGQGHASPIIVGDRVVVLVAAPFGDAQPAVHDSAPGVHDSVPVTHRHRYSVLAVSRAAGRVLWQTPVC